MRFLSSSRTRAGVLVLGLALVGGTGCITTLVTTAALSEMHDRRMAREREEARLQRIAALTRSAEAGDPDAMTSLAAALMAARNLSDKDRQRALAWLARAAEQGYGLAQAILGDLQSRSSVKPAWPRMKARQPDDDRGIALLQKAAVQACRYLPPREGDVYSLPIDPAVRLGDIFAADRRGDAAMLWHARSILHCGVPDAVVLADKIDRATTAEDKRAGFAMLLLTGDDLVIAPARAKLAPADAAAAEGQAAALRRFVAASEKEYPAPPRKETR